MKIRLLFFILLIVIVSTSTGCLSLPPISPYQSEHGVQIRGSVTKEQVQKVDEVLAGLKNKKMIQSIASLSCRPDDYSRGTLGKCHWTRDIWIVESSFTDPATLWHEIAHAYSMYLGADFLEKWKNAAGNVYSSDRTKYNYPARGVLTYYGSTDYWEDIAEWFEGLKIYLFLNCQYYAIVSLKQKDELFTEPYISKIKLLHDYEFITDQDYEKILQK